jgi:hypothetical protein
MRLSWFIPIALLIPLRLSATDAAVGARVATITIDPKEITVLHLRPEFESTIRMPEEVTSVILGSPGEFKAEHNEGEPEYVYVIFLESRGHYLLSLPSATEATLHPSQVPHALEIVNIRVALAKTGVLHSWTSGLEIASRNLVLENGAVKDFDAVAGIEVDGRSRTIGIEYERNPKAAARYRAIREVFERDETTDAILYMVTNDDLLYLLALELRAMRKRLASF